MSDRRESIEGLAAKLIDEVACAGLPKDDALMAVGLLIRDVIPKRIDRLRLSAFIEKEK